jgi:hypothetical protein
MDVFLLFLRLVTGVMVIEFRVAHGILQLNTPSKIFKLDFIELYKIIHRLGYVQNRLTG